MNDEVNVSARIVGNNILRPFFIEGMFTTEKYFKMKQHIISAISARYPDNQNPKMPCNL